MNDFPVVLNNQKKQETTDGILRDPSPYPIKKAGARERIRSAVRNVLAVMILAGAGYVIVTQYQQIGRLEGEYQALYQEHQEQEKKLNVFLTQQALEGEESLEGEASRSEGLPFEIDPKAWNYIMISDVNPLPKDYKLQLVTFQGGHKVDGRIAENLSRLLEAGKNEGMELIVCSSYRDYEKQNRLFNNSIDKLVRRGMSYQDAFYRSKEQYALTGASEHHSGLAVDIVGKSYQTLDEKEGDTPEAKWLRAHCAEYGFILRYPKNKESITGIEYEPWHFRYVGKQAAEYIMLNQLTLEEFLELAEK